jgi:hypothetical protein
MAWPGGWQFDHHGAEQAQQAVAPGAAPGPEPLSETSGGSHNEGPQSTNPRMRTPVAIVLAEPSTCEEAAESFQQNMSEWCASTRRRAEWEATLEKLQQGCKGRTDRTMTTAVADESRLARKRMGRTTYVLTLRGSVLISSKNSAEDGPDVVRAKPSSATPVVGVMAVGNGSTVEITEETDDGWLRIYARPGDAGEHWLQKSGPRGSWQGATDRGFRGLT